VNVNARCGRQCFEFFGDRHDPILTFARLAAHFRRDLR
jgi:hypothetical protein